MLNWGAKGLVRLLAQQSSVQVLSGASAALQASTCPAAVTAAAAVIQQHCAGAWQHLTHLQQPQQQHIHTSACCEAAGSFSQHVVQLDRLRPAAGSTKLVRSGRLRAARFPAAPLPIHAAYINFMCVHHLQAKRWGRGDGGGRGTYCGRGVKGQKARKGE